MEGLKCNWQVVVCAGKFSFKNVSRTSLILLSWWWQGRQQSQKYKYRHYHHAVCSVAQLCPTLCDPMDCSPPGSSVHGISQASMLEWVTISSSRGSSQPRDRTHVSCIGRWILYHWSIEEAPLPPTPTPPKAIFNLYKEGSFFFFFFLVERVPLHPSK